MGDAAIIADDYIMTFSLAEPVNVRPSWETLRSLPMIT